MKAIYLRLSEAESEALQGKAAAAGMSKQDYLRREVIGGELSDGPVPPLAGSKEAAEILGGLTKQQMHARSKKPGFPEPAQRLAGGPVWRRCDIERVAAQ